MNTHGRITAAVGSVALNVALALILSQGAGAATPSTNEPVPAPRSHVVYQGVDHRASDGHCASEFRARAIIAVLLAFVV